MRDHRIVASGTSLDFTCENKRFKTDINEGHEHYAGHGYKGSVTPKPIYEDGGSLWLEHVIDTSNGNKCFWFMWYDENGLPNIPMSGVMDKGDIKEVIKNIADIQISI